MHRSPPPGAISLQDQNTNTGCHDNDLLVRTDIQAEVHNVESTAVESVNMTATARYDKLVFPSGKLAALSRKKNELTVLMKEKATIDIINKEYAIYTNKLDVLLYNCETILSSNISPDDKTTFIGWKSNFMQDVIVFRDEVHLYIQELTAKNTTKASKKATSIASSKSSVMSLRAKLADERAKRRAEEENLKQQEMLELKRAQLEKEEKALNIKRMKDYEDNLEQEIIELEGEKSSLSSSSSQSFDRKTVENLVKRQNEVTNSIIKNQEMLLLPRNEPKVFDGSDLTQFKTFMRAF